MASKYLKVDELKDYLINRMNFFPSIISHAINVLPEANVIDPKDCWNNAETNPPKEKGEYLCVVNLSVPYITKCDYSPNLYEVDSFRFWDKKGQHGFYKYDPVFDYYFCQKVSHWMELPSLPDGLKK